MLGLQVNIGDRILISRAPTSEEDPEGAWLDEFEELLGKHGTIIKDAFPYAKDSIYARVEIDNYDDFFLPTAILIKL